MKNAVEQDGNHIAAARKNGKRAARGKQAAGDKTSNESIAAPGLTPFGSRRGKCHPRKFQRRPCVRRCIPPRHYSHIER